MIQSPSHTKWLRLGILCLTLTLSTLCFSCNQEGKTENKTAPKIQKPVLSLSTSEANEIKKLLNTNDVLKVSFEQHKEKADKAIQNGIEVPIPKDPGGGYTHEKHKRNYGEMYSAGIAYMITADTIYSKFVTDMLLEYAKMYSKLPLHPKRKENHPAGKLFWQGLNESVWLVNSIQAYNLVSDAISIEDKKTIEDHVFKKVAEFISVDSKKTFNKIHNHGTWAVAGVGMTGYVLKDQDMIDRALYGSNKDKETGFLKQIDMLFSPEGYYSEGPYYQRYAMMPFMLFAQAIQINQPDLKIFEYRDQLLGKAVTTVLQLTDENGAFFPFNDALKEKNYLTSELIFASNIAYAYYEDSSLLPITLAHNKVSISGAGLEVAKALKNFKPKVYEKKPLLITDGKDGTDGGLALLRMPNGKKDEKLTAVFKFASQGMGHGHFDRLSIFFYDGKQEILQDYGAARFLNVESKQGGRYLPENTTWAKQTIAHNTVTIDQNSQFDGKVKAASKVSPQLLFSNLKDTKLQIVSAKEENAYKGINMQRTLALIKDSAAERPPFIIDIYAITSKEKHQYDLNFMYQGQLMDTNFEYTKESTLSELGAQNGYQHLWKLGEGKSDQNFATLTWLNQNRFYSISSIINPNSAMVFSRLGANDPNFNLRNDASYMIRENNKEDHVFVNIIEPHGNFDPKLESVQNPHSDIKNIQLIHSDDTYTIVKVIFKNEEHYTLMIVNKEHDPHKQHKITVDTIEYQWTGNYNLKTN
ncbi:heparinase II/III domain-containing protein [Aquimarina sp. 2201CG14-23]|uniref:heparinase II/III domain-containing protein n=1 Tax=Aquimarina mycalae TaxID=3040073 RepID=UPI002477F2CF|nr:heparinase II/III family protein [Aquimarina sp. 2201CG14-23]MDH7448074.1 heparinase II/III family protein [Aquimarina sp. 2201CG14-23]